DDEQARPCPDADRAGEAHPTRGLLGAMRVEAEPGERRGAEVHHAERGTAVRLFADEKPAPVDARNDDRGQCKLVVHRLSPASRGRRPWCGTSGTAARSARWSTARTARAADA